MNTAEYDEGRTRLEKFSKYQEDWDCEGGLSFPYEIIQTARLVLDILEKNNLPAPYVFPGVNGNIILEYYFVVDSDWIELDISQERSVNVITCCGDTIKTKALTVSPHRINYPYLIQCVKRFICG